MAKNMIVYFSQGGTTAKVAEAIASGLRSKNHQVDLHNMNDGKPPVVHEKGHTKRID